MKQARATFVIEEKTWNEFKRYCDGTEQSASTILRAFIHNTLAQKQFKNKYRKAIAWQYAENVISIYG